MTDASTPSFSEFVRRHRSAAAAASVHDQASAAAISSFDWLFASSSGIANATLGAANRRRPDRDRTLDRDIAADNLIGPPSGIGSLGVNAPLTGPAFTEYETGGADLPRT